MMIIIFNRFFWGAMIVIFFCFFFIYTLGAWYMLFYYRFSLAVENVEFMYGY